MKKTILISIINFALCYCSDECDFLKDVHRDTGCCDGSFVPQKNDFDISELKKSLQHFEDSAFGQTSRKMPTIVESNEIIYANRYMYLGDRYQIHMGGHRINAPRLPTHQTMLDHPHGQEFLTNSGTFLSKDRTLRGKLYPKGTKITIEEYEGQIADFVYEEQRSGHQGLDGTNFSLVALNAQVHAKTLDGKNAFFHATSFLVEKSAVTDEDGEKCKPEYGSIYPITPLCNLGVAQAYPWIEIIDYAIDESSVVYDMLEDLQNSFCILGYAPTNNENPFADMWKISVKCYTFVEGESRADFPVRVGRWFERRV